jgi:glutamate racemase
MLGPGVTLYDPSRPVARRVRQLLVQQDALAQNEQPTFRYYTTGDAAIFNTVASKLLRIPVTTAQHIEL